MELVYAFICGSSILFVIALTVYLLSITHRNAVRDLRARGCICELSFAGPTVDRDCPVHGAWDEG